MPIMNVNVLRKRMKIYKNKNVENACPGAGSVHPLPIVKNALKKLNGTERSVPYNVLQVPMIQDQNASNAQNIASVAKVLSSVKNAITGSITLVELVNTNVHQVHCRLVMSVYLAHLPVKRAMDTRKNARVAIQATYMWMKNV